MRKSIVWSAALHALVVVLAVFGLPRLWEGAQVTDQPTIIEVVNIDEKTTTEEQPKPVPKKPEPKAEKEPPPPPPEPPQAKPRPAPAPPAPPKVAEKPAPEAEKVPEKPKPEPKKPPEKKPEPKKAAPKPTPPPKAVAQARPQRKPPEPPEDFLQSVLRDVAPEERAPQRDETQPEETKPAPAPQEDKPRRQAPLDAVATTSEIDAIRHAIEQCWNVPAGARDAKNLVVVIRVWVNPDGTVRDARLEQDQSRLGDSFFRAAAESAMRAVLNPRCQPLPIPPKKYEQFRNLVLEFNPKTAAGS